MRSLRTRVGWLTLTGVLCCAGLALGQTGGVERIDADMLQRAQSTNPASAPEQRAKQGQATVARQAKAAQGQGSGTRADAAVASQHRYRHRWQKQSGAAGSSQPGATQRTGVASASPAQRAQAGEKSTGSTGLRDAVRRRDRIHVAAAGSGQRDPARANDRLRARQQRCSEAGEHRQQRRGSGSGNAPASSGAGSARGGRP